MKSIFKILSGLAVMAVTASSMAVTYTETFPDPLGGWQSRWLYQNSNMANWYVANGNPDINNRGNNPIGLWIADSQGVGSGVGGNAVINFNPTFGAQLTSLSFGMECFVSTTVTIYDMSNNVLASGSFSGGGFDFDHADIISASSSNGISGFSMTSTSGSVEGNTSVDNFRAEGVPEPATMAALGIGAMALIRRRRK